MLFQCGEFEARKIQLIEGGDVLTGVELCGTYCILTKKRSVTNWRVQHFVSGSGLALYSLDHHDHCVCWNVFGWRAATHPGCKGACWLKLLTFSHLFCLESMHCEAISILPPLQLSMFWWWKRLQTKVFATWFLFWHLWNSQHIQGWPLIDLIQIQGWPLIQIWYRSRGGLSYRPDTDPGVASHTDLIQIQGWPLIQIWYRSRGRLSYRSDTDPGVASHTDLIQIQGWPLIQIWYRSKGGHRVSRSCWRLTVAQGWYSNSSSGSFSDKYRGVWEARSRGRSEWFLVVSHASMIGSGVVSEAGIFSGLPNLFRLCTTKGRSPNTKKIKTDSWKRNSFLSANFAPISQKLHAFIWALESSVDFDLKLRLKWKSPACHTGSRCLCNVAAGIIAGHLGAADGLKTLSIHVYVYPHFGM